MLNVKSSYHSISNFGLKPNLEIEFGVPPRAKGAQISKKISKD